MPITSTSTLEEIEAEYLDTLSWEESGDLALAYRFRAAVRALLLKKPTRSQLATMSMQFDLNALQKQLDEVTAAIQTHPDAVFGGGTTVVDMRGFRT